MTSPQIEIIIPALNEEDSIGRVVTGMLANGASRVIVVDNGSTDGTPRVAADFGASVVHESRRGYGLACRAGISALQGADIVVFADGDGCDDPSELARLTEPTISNRADLCIGSRMTGNAEEGALPFHSRFGNGLASVMMRLLFGQKVTDMGPFRAIRRDTLDSLQMSEPNFGWNVEMQAKAALGNWRVMEVPVSYRKRRSGTSKITGNLRKSLEAGAVITGTILKYRLLGKMVNG